MWAWWPLGINFQDGNSVCFALASRRGDVKQEGGVTDVVSILLMCLRVLDSYLDGSDVWHYARKHLWHLGPVIPAGTWCPVSGEHHKTRSLEENLFGLRWTEMDHSALIQERPGGSLVFLRRIYVMMEREDYASLLYFFSGCLCERMWIETSSSFLCERRKWKCEFRCPTLPASVVVDCWNLLLMSWYPTCVVVEEMMIF